MMMPLRFPATGQRLPLVPGVVILAFILVGSVWLAAYFSPEARIRRATGKLVELVRKDGAESEIALGLSANRLGNYLATTAELELSDYGSLAEGRTEIVQLYAHIRHTLGRIALEEPKIGTVRIRQGEIRSYVVATYRVAGSGEERQGEGKAELRWLKSDEGWRIVYVHLALEAAGALKETLK